MEIVTAEKGPIVEEKYCHDGHIYIWCREHDCLRKAQRSSLNSITDHHKKFHQESSSPGQRPAFSNVSMLAAGKLLKAERKKEAQEKRAAATRAAEELASNEWRAARESEVEQHGGYFYDTDDSDASSR